MNIDKKNKAIEVLNRNELALAKGGEGRDYYVIIIDGEEVRVYV